MTKTQLKKDIIEMMNKKYNTECQWSQEDLDMLDYYYATLGKNCELNYDNSSIIFSKSGYSSEVSVESWEVISINDEKKQIRIH